MTILRALTRGLRTLFRREAFERDLDDEVQHFVEMAAQERMRAGSSREDALRAARREIGGVQSVKEEVRSVGWEIRVETMLRDVRYGLRSLRRNPSFTVAAVLTLGIGIGGTTTIFSLVNAILLRPPVHVRAPHELVSIFTSDYSGPLYGVNSYPDFEEYKRQASLFGDVMLFSLGGVGVGEGDAMRREGLELVSDNYFRMLGIAPEVGRAFLPDEGRVGAPAAVTVIGHDLWQRTFGGRRDAVGSTVRLNGVAFTIIGIAPSGYRGGLRGLAVDVWIPITSGKLLGGDLDFDLRQRGNRSHFVMARLRPGVTLAQAEAGLATVARNLTAAYPDAWRNVSGMGRRITLASEFDSRVPPQVRSSVLGFMALLMGTVGLVLLVCCANVASLMLARAARRTREMGVRLSLGATRGRVMRQLLIESCLVAMAGGVVGVLIARLATRGILHFQPPLPVKVAIDLSLDTRVLAFALAASLGTGLVYGIAPALRASRARVTGMLKGEFGERTFGRRLSLQNALVICQVAVSVVLLASALFFVRSLRSANGIDPGFATDHLLLFDAEPRPDVREPGERNTVLEELRAQVASLPGVTGVTWGSHVPMGLGASRRNISVEGYRPAEGEDMEYHFSQVGPGYFEVMRLPLAKGRGIQAGDRVGAPRVAVVSESFVRRFWKGDPPLGKRVSMSGPNGPSIEVVGVSRDVRQLSLTDPPGPFLYTSSLQDPGPSTFFVRVAVPLSTLGDAIRQTVARAAPSRQVTNLRTMEAQVGMSLVPQRVAGFLLSLFGVTALLLAAIGLYGVVAFAVAARTREIGVRMALGAGRGDVVRLVVRQGAGLVVVGLGIGLPAAWAASRLMAGFLIGEEAADAMTYVGAASLLVVVALLASWIPARRAAGVHPMTALRTD